MDKSMTEKKHKLEEEMPVTLYCISIHKSYTNWCEQNLSQNILIYFMILYICLYCDIEIL